MTAEQLPVNHTKTTLSQWKFRQDNDNNWTQSKHGRAESEIFVDLLDHGLIKDPLLGLNEIDAQWVGKKKWHYKAVFTLDKDLTDKHHVYLEFEGLDTIATIFLNNVQVARSTNMFLGGYINIADYAKPGENTLTIAFDSALECGRSLQQKYGKLACSNGDPSRVYVRKAQYHYGWDWGPVLLSCGPYKPIHIHVFTLAIDFLNTWFDQTLQFNDDNECTSGEIRGVINFHGQVPPNSEYEIKVFAPDSTSQTLSKAPLSSTDEISYSTEILDPQLWWPVGYGKQHLYRVVVAIRNNETTLCEYSQKIGFREVKLIQENLPDNEPSNESTSFYFSVNKVPIWISGSCWIPADSFLTKLGKKQYSKWIRLAVSGNQNMLRVWGGGIYEHDEFYNSCDEEGILVWQDFMFACGIYPANIPDFLASVKDEAEYQIKRLRKHPSVVLYCGNNEDYQIAEQHELYIPSESLDNYLDTKFPARELYENIFPHILERLSPKSIYRPGSPWGKTSHGAGVNDVRVGDVHQWNVWHGSQEKYQNWYKLAGRFISEFGMEAMPCKETVKTFVDGDSSQLYAQSRAVEHHNKALNFERRLGLYVMENITIPSMNLSSVDAWIYATQLIQAESTAFAFRSWRRQWKEHKYVGGALIWQLNDCWPVASWSICDYHGRPKLSYYAMKRECQPITVGIQRNEVIVEDEEFGDNSLFDYRKKKFVIEFWASNLTLNKVHGEFFLDKFHVSTGERVRLASMDGVELEQNTTTELIADLDIGDNYSDDLASNWVIYGSFREYSTKQVFHTSDWPQPLKYLALKDRGVTIEYDSKREQYVVHAKKPTKCIYIRPNDYDEDRGALSDNGFDIFPGHSRYFSCSSGVKSFDYYQKSL